jgi:hypothetical protein
MLKWEMISVDKVKIDNRSKTLKKSKKNQRRKKKRRKKIILREGSHIWYISHLWAVGPYSLAKSSPWWSALVPFFSRLPLLSFSIFFTALHKRYIYKNRDRSKIFLAVTNIFFSSLFPFFPFYLIFLLFCLNSLLLPGRVWDCVDIIRTRWCRGTTQGRFERPMGPADETCPSKPSKPRRGDAHLRISLFFLLIILVKSKSHDDQ